MYLGCVVQNEPSTTIGAIHRLGFADREIDQRMSERAAATVASDGCRFHMNYLCWLHKAKHSHRNADAGVRRENPGWPIARLADRLTAKKTDDSDPCRRINRPRHFPSANFPLIAAAAV